MFETRWYQEGQLRALIDYFARNKKGNPLVAAPTGTGKSYMIAMFKKWIMQNYPTTKIMMLTHVKELIEQDFEKLNNLWPQNPAGIYSAGLKRRDTKNQIVFGSVKSVLGEMERSYEKYPTLAHNLRHFGERHIVIVDEAHLISPNDASTYRKVFAELIKIYPGLRVVGYTATPYRLGQGMLTDGKNALFTDVCYDLTSQKNINRLISEGFLAPLVTLPTSVKVDTREVDLSSWDFNSSQLAKQIQKVMHKSLAETCQVFRNYNRKSAYVFCASVENCETATQMLRSFGFTAECVHSKKKGNDEIIKAHKEFKFQFLVSNNKLTTGIDHPGLDLLCVLRSTISPGLWIQMLGRGARPWQTGGKKECLVLDYGNNIARLGPFNDVRVPKTKSDKVGDMPVKICEGCGMHNHAAARFCAYCEKPFPRKANFEEKASNAKVIINSDFPVLQNYNVRNIVARPHQKQGKKACIKVEYHCGQDTFIKWLHPEQKGGFRQAFEQWWFLHCALELPTSALDAIEKINSNAFKRAVRIEVQTNAKYPEIKQFYFN